MKQFSLFLLLSISLPLIGQIKIDSFFTLSGSADTYFRYNLNSTNDASNGGTLAPATSFANLPGFAIGMFNMVGKYETAKSGFVADLVFGPRGRDAVFNSQGSLNIVNQAYAYYKPSEKFTFTLGKFNTYVGYEVISPVINFNYSTTYMFSYGPFSHAGIKINYDIGKGFGAMIGIFNPTDFTDFNPFGKYYGGGQLGYVFEKGAIYLNTLANDDFVQLDITATYNFNEKYMLGLNATSASDNFYGAALYSNYSFTKVFSAGIRAEYFKDNGIGILSKDESQIDQFNHVFDITLSSNFKLGHLRIIPEWRLDLFSDNLVFPDATSSTSKDKLSSLLLAAVYSF
jgi:hypothetical protein